MKIETLTLKSCAIVFAICILFMTGLLQSANIGVESKAVTPGQSSSLDVNLTGNSMKIMALNVPLKFAGGDINIDSVSFVGSLKKASMSATVDINNTLNTVSFNFIPSSDSPVISETSGLLARVYFTVDGGAANQTIVFDSICNRFNEYLPYRWNRVELADSNGVTVAQPDFTAGAVIVDQTLDIDDDNPAIPYQLSLKQNYPNPFNPSTTIEFTLPQREHVTLKVYNIFGQTVATLLDSPLEAGEHRLTWDAANKASSIYFYRLRYQDRVLTRKMTLLK